MATLDDVRAIVRELPASEEGVEGHRGGAAWRTKAGLFVWERGPSKAESAEWPDGVVVGVRTDDVDGILHAFADVCFTIPHFAGYPAVLVRLDAIDVERLRELVTDAWLLRAPKRVAAEWLAAQDAANAS